MAKRLTYNVITGNDTRLGMCFYYSPHFDQNIWRRTSSLTGERTKKDPAFKGFRQSSSRLKEASPIAASLYKMVPQRVKRYDLYRTLTGKAINMLKEGMEAANITETLKKEYIDPLLETPKEKIKNSFVEESESGDRVKCMRDFTSLPQINSRLRKTVRTRNTHLFQKIREDKSEVKYFSPIDSKPQPRIGINVSASPNKELDPPEATYRRNKTTAGLIYLGRLPECKKLKVWLRPVHASDFGLGIR